MPSRDIVVIGASAGGVAALKQLVSRLPHDLPASVFVVVHVSPQSPGLLAGILNKAGPLPAKAAEDGTRFECGHIYVAPPDQHMLLERDRIRVVRGPRENRHRPAIDPLFRSAAWAYGPRVIGVVLTGTLDDGTGGLWAVKSCGGMTVVQDPEEAPFPDMPAAAIQRIDVDHVLTLENIAALIVRLSHEATPTSSAPRPARIGLENELVLLHGHIPDMADLGAPSVFTCPTCHGALWELEDGEHLRYRCHTGHSFSSDTLLQSQSEEVEVTLYSALRALEQQAAAARRFEGAPHFNAERTKELEQRADAIRRLLATGTV